MSISKKTLLCKKLLGILIFLCGFFNVFSQQNHCEESHIKGKLSNKLQYFIQKNSFQKPETVFYLAIKTGSIHENSNESGYAHFLEHMAFKGGKRFPKKPFTQFLKEQGLQIGVHYNAVTNYNYTLYKITVPQKASIILQKQIFNFFVDIIDGLTLSQKDIEIEKKIVLAEKEVSPPLQKHFLFKLGESFYKERSPIGTEKSINAITTKKLKTFYKKWYQPKNVAVFVVGNVNCNKIERLIKKQFSLIKNKPIKNNKSNDKLYCYLNNSVKNNYSENKDYTKVYLQWASNHKLSSPKKNLKNKIINKIFINLLQKRLDTLLKREAEYLFINNQYFLADVSYTTFSYTSRANLKEGIKKILREIKRISSKGIQKKELKYYKKKELKKIKQNKCFKKNSKTIIDKYVNYYLGIEYPFNCKHKDSFSSITVNKISTNDIKYEAKKLWDSEKLLVFINHSESSKDSISFQQIKKIKQQLNSEKLQPIYFHNKKNGQKKTIKNNISLQTAYLTDKQPVEKKYFKNLGVTKLKYKNNVEVYLKPIQNDFDEIKVLGTTPGGLSSITDSLYYQYEHSVSYIDFGGVGNLNYKQLQQFLDNKNFGLTFSISEYERNLYGYTSSKQVKSFFKYLFLKMTDSKANEKEFKKVIREEIASLKKEKKSTFTINEFDKKIAELKNTYFPKRKSAKTEQEFNKIDIFKMKNFYNKAFANANGWKFVIAGNFSVRSILPIINMYLGNLPKQTKTLKNKKLFDKNDFKNKIYLSANENTTSISFLFYGKYFPNVKNSILISLSEQLISNKITQSLRQKYGLVYTPIISIEKNIHSTPFSIIEIRYDCKSSNVDKTKNVVIETITEILNNRISEEELQGYKRGSLLRYQSTFSNDIHHYSFGLYNSLKNKEDVKDLEFFSNILYEISADDLSKFVNQIVDFNNMKIIFK